MIHVHAAGKQHDRGSLATMYKSFSFSRNPMSVRLMMIGLGLAGTTSEPSAAQQTPGAEAPAAGELQAYAVDREQSSLVVVTHKAGLLSFLGHEHAIIPEGWSVALCLADPVPVTSRGSLVIETGSLVIDSDSARALAGLGDGPGADDVIEIQRTLLNADHLAADAYPTITLDIDSTERTEDEALVAHGRLTLRGITRAVAIPVVAESVATGTIRLSGALRIRQSDFGLTPESTAGMVKVSDDVDLRFELVAATTGRPCPPGPQ